MTACSLGGIGVLVTRPEGQDQNLAATIRALGGDPVLFPGVSIEALGPDELASRTASLGRTDLAIFVSPTAVRFGLPGLIERFGSLDQTRIAAVGHSTAAELRKHGMGDVIVPEGGSGGEALANCSGMRQVAGCSVLVVRGEGGNDTLGSILEERGASVSFHECYRRNLPEQDFDAVESLLRAGRIGAWMATSSEILDNLLRLAGKQAALLRKTPLFVNHPHIARRAFSQAIEVIFVTAGGDAGLSEGLTMWFCRPRGSMS